MNVLLQLSANGLAAAGLYALLGISWAVIFNTTRIFHVAHGVTYAAGGYVTVMLAERADLPVLLTLPVSIAAGAVIGLLFQLVLYRPLLRRQATGTHTFVASLGAMGVGTAALLFLAGPNPLITGGPLDAVWQLGSVRLTLAQVVTAAIGFGVVIVVTLLWQFTWAGKALRAVTSDPEVAATVGIRVDHQHLIAMAVGGALGSLSGSLFAINQGASPEMILNGILLAAIAVLVGGLGSLPGAAVAGVLLALLMNVGIWQISSRWQYGIAFGCLMVFMLVRPRGLFGERLLKAQL